MLDTFLRCFFCLFAILRWRIPILYWIKNFHFPFSFLCCIQYVDTLNVIRASVHYDTIWFLANQVPCKESLFRFVQLRLNVSLKLSKIIHTKVIITLALLSSIFFAQRLFREDPPYSRPVLIFLQLIFFCFSGKKIVSSQKL